MFENPLLWVIVAVVAIIVTFTAYEHFTPSPEIPEQLSHAAMYPVPTRLDDASKEGRPQQIGDRWKESWRSYFWRNYPMSPCFTPATNQPVDMMDRLVSRHSGLFPQVSCQWPNKVDQCVAYANLQCRGHPDPDFCFRRTYGKCLTCEI